MLDTIDLKAGTYLGKQITDYKQSYDPNILVPLEREKSRSELNLPQDVLGSDSWHIYELSFLTKNNEPVTAVGKLVIPSDSKYFIESKSMKMYFYAMNMEKFGETPEEGIKEIKKIVVKDLKKATKSKVNFDIHIKNKTKNILKNYKRYQIENNNYYETLQTTNEIVEEFLEFPNIRSNCRITHQPDFATMLIHYKGKKLIQKSMIDYIFRMRTTNKFHEECCELIFNDLKKLGYECGVAMLYTRRGGIDICPQRFTSKDFEIKELTNSKKLTNKTINQ